MALIVAATIIAISFIFYFLQNKKNTIGGKIALCKLFWLDYTLIAWFFLPIVFYFQNKSENHFNVFYAISISMWIRGIIELYMLYCSKNWTPPIGIVHNMFTFLLALVVMISSLPMDIISLFSSLGLLISLLLETYYAYAFYKIVKDKTKGDDAIWFASKGNPEFKKILKITSLANIFVYLLLIPVTYT